MVSSDDHGLALVQTRPSNIQVVLTCQSNLKKRVMKNHIPGESMAPSFDAKRPLNI
jgi:hypothetical protein